jgi:hypothetical protein
MPEYGGFIPELKAAETPRISLLMETLYASEVMVMIVQFLNPLILRGIVIGLILQLCMRLDGELLLLNFG